MSKGKGVALKLALISGLVLGVSYFVDASFFLAMITVCALCLFGEIVHMPENMPGAVDNLDRKGLHPAKAMFLLLGIMVALIALGEFFPELYSYGFAEIS